MKINPTSVEAEVYRCAHCAGVASILISKHTKKGTWPEIEFCPFCGLSNIYRREFDNGQDKLLNEKKL
jgi:Cft2 family RNA processing exonuclease